MHTNSTDITLFPGIKTRVSEDLVQYAVVEIYDQLQLWYGIIDRATHIVVSPMMLSREDAKEFLVQAQTYTEDFQPIVDVVNAVAQPILPLVDAVHVLTIIADDS